MKPEKQLYQWDVNQYLTGINPAAQYVDYQMGNEVIRIKSDGTRCRIPDEVLQTYGGKTCYERYPDGTYRAYSFSVLYAPKPPDYVYTPEERTTFEALTARVDAAIDEIKRRADSGEFTPVKGVDYFTESEKNELMESVSTGAIGEFRKVVDTATTEYNANAAEKLEDYNQNHTAKVAEYDANAENKTAEFDANAAALQTEVDRLRGECDNLAAEKANIDGYYEEMKVGDAEQLVATQFVEDNEPYLFRSTGGSSDVGNRAYIDQIVGGTVAWNQLYGNSVITGSTIHGVTFNPQSDGTIIVNGTPDGMDDIYFQITGNFSFGDHVVLLRGCPIGGSIPTYSIYLNDNGQLVDTGSGIVSKQVAQGKAFYIRIIKQTTTTFNNVKFKPQIIDLTQMFGSTIADYIYSLEQSQAGAGVSWFKKLFPKDYYPYNTGELLSVEGIQSHDSVGFNQWDEEWEVGDISSNHGNPINNTACWRSKNFIRIVPSASYYVYSPTSKGRNSIRARFYDANQQFIGILDKNGRSVYTEQLFIVPDNAHYMKFAPPNTEVPTHELCINLSDPSRNGEYEPYKKHSYPLDSSLTLRGIPKLDASNNLYYDGDEYESDGTVTRKYGIVDLGALTWTYDSGGFKTPISGRKFVGGDAKINYVLPLSYTYQYMLTDDKTISFSSVNTNMWIKDSSYATTDAFKAAMSGVMLVYELATPTTETAKPFQHIQIVDDFGTEELVSTGIVPVGHNTRYPANLRDKLQHLPSLASADGTYLIQQSGKQMSLIHMPAVFPDTPTEDGTYTLKTVVTGGAATLQWVAD